jgi:UDPglucose 6-dehydrogenase
MNILVVGDWHNAHITAVCLAQRGHKIQHASASDKGSMAAIGGDYHPPPLDVEEPGYTALLEQLRADGRLTYEGPLFVGNGFDLVWIALDTPVHKDGVVDPHPVISAAIRFGASAPRLVVSSQVPIGTCQTIYERVGLPLAHIPENMRLGDGLRTFLGDRVILGATNEDFQQDLFFEVLQIDKTSSRVVFCSLETAEMIKHATNAWLAMNISYANEISELGKPYDVDMEAVTRALHMDSRVGPKAPLVPGDGYGKTLARDVAVLAAKPGATLLPAIEAVNRSRSLSRKYAIWKKERP